MYGPTMGTFRAKPAMVAKKSPNRIRMPYSSTKNPTSAHRNKISSIPVANAAVPRHFCRRVKNRSVFCGPMVNGRPIRKRICAGEVHGKMIWALCHEDWG